MTNEEKEKKKTENLFLINTNIKIANILLPKMIKIQNEFLKDNDVKIKFGQPGNKVEKLFSAWLTSTNSSVAERYQKAINNQYRI